MLNIDEYATPDVANTAFLLRGAGSHAMSVGKRRRPDLDPFFVVILNGTANHTEATTCALWDAWREGWDCECARLSARWALTVDGRVIGDDVGERAQARCHALDERERHPADVDVRVVTVAEIVARRADPRRQLWHVEDRELDRPVGTFSDITDACEYARDLNGGFAVGGRYVVLDEDDRAIYSTPSVIHSAAMTRTPTVTRFPRCGRRLLVYRAVCGLRLSPGTDGLRCGAHGALEPVDVLPALFSARS